MRPPPSVQSSPAALINVHYALRPSWCTYTTRLTPPQKGGHPRGASHDTRRAGTGTPSRARAWLHCHVPQCVWLAPYTKHYTLYGASVRVMPQHHAMRPPISMWGRG